MYKAVLIRDGYGYTSDHDDEDSELSLDEVEDENEEEDADRRTDVRGAVSYHWTTPTRENRAPPNQSEYRCVCVLV